jgi:sulfate adenylyltransferase subunit 1 (EFTu-like GTPase family)
VTQSLEANVVWLDNQPLELHRTYLLKHTARNVLARAERIVSRTNVDTLAAEVSATLAANEIGVVAITTQRPLLCDGYEQNRSTGSFILIDPMSNATVAAGMIVEQEQGPCVVPRNPSTTQFHVTRFQQEQRAGHRAFTILISGHVEMAHRLERRLFESGHRVNAFEIGDPTVVAEICRVLNDAGVIAIYCSRENSASFQGMRQALGENNVLAFSTVRCGLTTEAAVKEIYALLRERGLVIND